MSPTIKVVLLGDLGVGKTCLRSQFVHHVFTNAYKATIGGDFLTTSVILPGVDSPEEPESGELSANLNEQGAETSELRVNGKSSGRDGQIMEGIPIIMNNEQLRKRNGSSRSHDTYKSALNNGSEGNDLMELGKGRILGAELTELLKVEETELRITDGPRQTESRLQTDSEALEIEKVETPQHTHIRHGSLQPGNNRNVSLEHSGDFGQPDIHGQPLQVDSNVSISGQTLYQSSTKVSLQIWDTAGQERFNLISQTFYRGAHVAVLVYDVTNYELVLGVRDWFHRFWLHCHVPHPGVVIVGNKIDRAAERCVDQAELRDVLCRNAPGPLEACVDWEKDVLEISCKLLALVEAVFRRVAEVGLLAAEETPSLISIQLERPQARCAC